jgi:hypothetical protein
MVEALVRRIGTPEALIVISIFALGWAVRWWHLGTPSLWWDELVHLAFASGPDPRRVFWRVQSGIPPGAGNAGSMPLDYLLLQAWTWLVPRPSVEHLEVYYRFPSYVWSGAALVAFWAYCRRAFGRTVAITATLLLSLSVPHILYAAEARFYSLLVLVSVLNLATFTWVMEAPALPRAWIAYGIVNILFFLTGLLSLLVLPWQFGALAFRVRWADGGDGWGRRAALQFCTVAGFAGVLLWYFLGVDLGTQGRRPGWGLLRVGPLTYRALDFVTLGDPRQYAVLLLGALVAPLYCARARRSMLPVVLTLLAIELTTMPVLVQVIKWKRYYFHPRHVLLLLPGLELLAALGIVGTLGFAASWVPAHRGHVVRAVVSATAVLLVLWVRLPAVADFVQRPHVYFRRTKTDRDFKSLVQDLRLRTADYRPGEKFLLVVDRIGPGHLGNPTLARYVRWYGLEDRVVVMGAPEFASVLERLQHGCDGPCRGRPGDEVAKRLMLRAPLESASSRLQLLELGSTIGSWPGTVRDAGVLVYRGARQPAVPGSILRRPYVGMFVAEPR